MMMQPALIRAINGRFQRRWLSRKEPSSLSQRGFATQMVTKDYLDFASPVVLDSGDQLICALRVFADRL
jgi:hypothetical protein